MCNSQKGSQCRDDKGSGRLTGTRGSRGVASLLHDALAAAARTARKGRRGVNAADEDEACASRVRSVIALVKRGELSRAAQAMTSGGIAQGSVAVERIL